MLGTSLLAPACSGSKRSDSATKERAQGAPYAKKKKTSRGPMKRGEGWRGRDLIATASSNKGDSKNNLKEGEGTSSTSANDNGS